MGGAIRELLGALKGYHALEDEVETIFAPPKQRSAFGVQEGGLIGAFLAPPEERGVLHVV